MLRRMMAAALLAAALVSLPARASQDNQVLPTTGLVTAVEFSSLVSAAIAALNTCNSGDTAPANATGGAPAAGQCWDDTSGSPTIRKVYTGTAWVTVGYIDASNSLWIPQIGGGTATLASASTLDLCSVPQTYVFVTGTTTVTSLGESDCQIGTLKILRFAGALTLTYNASTLRMPGNISRSIAAGDTIHAVRSSATRWDVVMAPPAAEAAPAADANPVGTMLSYAGFSLPDKYQWCSGATVSRTTYADYLAAVSTSQTVTRTNGSPTLTGFSSTEQFRSGMDVEGTGIPAGATILSKTSTTVTLSANATSSGASAVTIFAFGNGNGSTTVTLPDMRGRVAAGRDDLNDSAASRLTSSTPSSCTGNGLGASCGNQQGTLTEAQLPSVSKSVSISGTTSSSGSHDHFTIVGSQNSSLNVTSTRTLTFGQQESSSAPIFWEMRGTASTPTVSPTSSGGAHTHTFSGSGNAVFGSGNAHTRLQPTLIVNCIVKVSN